MTNNDASSYASILVVSTHTSITVGSNHLDSLNSIRRLATLAVSDPRLATLAPLLGVCVWGGVDVVKIGEIKVSVQKLCLKQGFFEDTNLDHLTSGWPGAHCFRGDANFDMFPKKYG